LEVGKRWFYAELGKLGNVHTKKGYETKELRLRLGLKKSSNKLKNDFSAHCVDSWVLANSHFEKGGQGGFVGGAVHEVTVERSEHISPDNKDILKVTPLRFYRRQLHAQKPAYGGIRRPYGGTRSEGFKRGAYVKHPKYGVCFVGGASLGRISLHSLASGKRLTQNANPLECNFLTYASFRIEGL
jgi:hypothetical protein